MKTIKELIKNPVNLAILITCVIVSVYFLTLLYKEVKPKNWKEQRIECLKLGSDARARECIRILNE